MISTRKPGRLTRACALLAILAWNSPASAGEIAGLPPHLLPTVSPDYTFFLGNDFLAPGTNDDFRTQQIIATARVRQRWIAILDHSMMTRADAVFGPPARTDLMSLSLGYEAISNRGRSASRILTLGIGLRGAGNFEGSRIQNGFHTLVESGTSFLPYTATRRTDATLWALGESHRILRQSGGGSWLSDWDKGYWLRAGALATADGQLDVVAGAYAIASRPNLDIWAGLRRDWREGYRADAVQIETAREESKLAIAVGLRWGSLVLETAHRFDSFASYGQLSFVSSAETRKRPTERTVRGDLQLGMYLPQMLFQIAGRRHTRLLTADTSPWRESLLVELRGGQPQFGRDVNRFVETAQLTAGLEWSRPLWNAPDWLRFYLAPSVGWRSEQLVGRGSLDGTRSASVGKAVVQFDLGLEIDAVRLRSNWRHSLRFGVSGWLPTDTETVLNGGIATELQRPGAAIAIVWALNYH